MYTGYVYGICICIWDMYMGYVYGICIRDMYMGYVYVYGICIWDMYMYMYMGYVYVYGITKFELDMSNINSIDVTNFIVWKIYDKICVCCEASVHLYATKLHNSPGPETFEPCAKGWKLPGSE